MAAIKPDKIREEVYDTVVEGMKTQGFEPIGRCKEGLVYTNHIDDEQVVIKVIKKKKEIPAEEITPITNYEEKITTYEAEKEKKKSKKKEEEKADFQAA